jgi:hypothetical protein
LRLRETERRSNGLLDGPLRALDARSLRRAGHELFGSTSDRRVRLTSNQCWRAVQNLKSEHPEFRQHQQMEVNLNPAVRVSVTARRRCAPMPAGAASSAFAETLARAKSTARRMRARRPSGLVVGAPDTPPPEVQRELAAAARACQALAAQGKELRFDRSADGRVQVELIDVCGQPLDVTPTGLFQLLQQAD